MIVLVSSTFSNIIFSASSWGLPVIIDSRRIAIVCAFVSAEMYRHGTFARNAIANASVDLPAPGVPAIMETSARRIMILFCSKVANTGGNGSPPISAFPTERVNVRKLECCPFWFVLTYPDRIALIWCTLWCWTHERLPLPLSACASSFSHFTMLAGFTYWCNVWC